MSNGDPFFRVAYTDQRVVMLDVNNRPTWLDWLDCISPSECTKMVSKWQNVAMDHNCPTTTWMVPDQNVLKIVQKNIHPKQYCACGCHIRRPENCWSPVVGITAGNPIVGVVGVPEVDFRMESHGVNHKKDGIFNQQKAIVGGFAWKRISWCVPFQLPCGGRPYFLTDPLKSKFWNSK